MAFTKYLLPALAVAGTALAQCDGPTTTIQSQGDASALSGCSTIKGDVIIASTANAAIAINGVQQITGDLSCQNAGQLTELSADQLGTIGGRFLLENLTILSTLAFSSLNNVNEIYWQGLPALQGLNFPQGISQAQNMLISNTQLNTLAGIELETIGNIDIDNNPYLSTVNVNQITTITGTLNIAANYKNLVITFDNLQSANNMTFRNVSSVSMPSLYQVNGSLGFYSDTFQSFSAPNLTATGGALAFVDSPNLSNISMPKLIEVGAGFLIANNTNLLSIDGFPKLQTIVGALDFAGTFNNASLPALKDVRGGLNIQTSSTTFDCTPFENDKSNSIVKGVFTCAAKQTAPNINPNGASSAPASSATSSSGAAAANFDPTTPLTGLGALLAALLMI
jgi:hypothetical protein